MPFPCHMIFSGPRGTQITTLHAIQSPQICFYFKGSVLYSELFILLNTELALILLYIDPQHDLKAVLLFVD